MPPRGVPRHDRSICTFARHAPCSRAHSPPVPAMMQRSFTPGDPDSRVWTPPPLHDSQPWPECNVVPLSALCLRALTASNTLSHSLTFATRCPKPTRRINFLLAHHEADCRHDGTHKRACRTSVTDVYKDGNLKNSSIRYVVIQLQSSQSHRIQKLFTARSSSGAGSCEKPTVGHSQGGAPTETTTTLG